MSLKINPIIASLIIASIFILIFAVIKGCNKSKDQQITLVNYKELIKKHQQDSVEQVKEKTAYNDSMEFLNGQLLVSDTKLFALSQNLEGANNRITKLLNKHTDIQPSSDTSVTTVPNVFIEDCAGCFKELNNGQQLVLKYKAEKDIQEQILFGKINVKDNRISSLEKINGELWQTNSGLLTNIKTIQNKWKPKGRLYLSIGALWNYAPYGVGFGGMYQDNRFRQYGAKIYFGSFGKMVETSINIPLSLKFK